MGDPRLKGQEVSVRLIRGGVVVSNVTSMGTFNDQVLMDLKQEQFLGETADQFDELFHGYKFDFEFQVSKANWAELQPSIVARARRATPNLVFNIVRTDYFNDGSSVTYTYTDVKFGSSSTSIASRADYVKVKMEGGCAERAQQISAAA